MKTEGKELMTTKQCGAYLGVSERSVARLISGRRIGYHKLGRLTRIAQMDADKFLEANHVRPRW